jgi:chorismate synthase
VYCWEDANIGSPFKTKKCVGESQLDELISQRQAQRDALNRAGGNYGAGK